MFRVLAEASCWPGRLVALPPARVLPPSPWLPALVQVARTLLDAQVTVAVVGPSAEALGHYFAVNAGVPLAAVDAADFVVAAAPFDLDVTALRPGTALAPDASSTLLVACAHLAANGTGSGFDLSGRGILGEQRLVVDDAVAGLLGRVSAREDEYPLGIDVILVAPTGLVAALPRTSRWRRRVPTWAM